MSSGIGKKIGDFALKGISNIYDGLRRRTKISDAGLVASQGVNMDRITKFILYKSHKAYAMKEYGMKLDDIQSVKEIAWSMCPYTKEKATKVANDTIHRYSSSIAMEKISDAALKVSKLFNRIGEDNTEWGNIADVGFKPAAYKLDNHVFNCNYVNEVFGIPKEDLKYLALYADIMFTAGNEDATTMAVQVIAFEKIMEAAFKASRTLTMHTGYAEEPTEPTHNKEKDDDPFQMRFPEAIDFAYTLEPKLQEHVPSLLHEFTRDESRKAEFRGNRDEMFIFKDSEGAGHIYRVMLYQWWSRSSCKINWERMTKFMEFKARKEYAMEIYGTKLGDFHSLKETALKLFEITEARAAEMASLTMEKDSESIAFEKIADAVFKASKILNWRDGNEERPVWHGNIGDASGFKSPKSMSNFCENMDLEARKAYTMEAFGVNSVDIDYIKDFAVDVFMKYNSVTLDARDAVIMACQTVAIDHVVDAVSKNLNLPLQLEVVAAKETRAMSNRNPPGPLCRDFLFSNLSAWFSESESSSRNARYSSPQVTETQQNHTSSQTSGLGGRDFNPSSNIGMKKSEGESVNTCNGISFGRSVLKKTDPLSYEAKVERYFERVAEAKNLDELSQIPVPSLESALLILEDNGNRK